MFLQNLAKTTSVQLFGITTKYTAADDDDDDNDNDDGACAECESVEMPLKTSSDTVRQGLGFMV